MMDNFFAGHMYGFGWGIVNFLGVIVFWVFIILLVVWVIRELSKNNSQSNRTNSHEEQRITPVEILKERFARGEITKKEFEERRGLLE